MSDDPLPPAGRTDRADRAEQRAVEAAAIRKRWITLGELLALVAVVISALTLWSNWSDRQESKAELAATAKRASTRAARLVLVAATPGAKRLTLHPASPEQTVQSQTIRFPTALALAPVETTGEPRIEADWFEGALKKARGALDLPDDSRGDERLPLVIETVFLVDGATHRDVALYDLGYTINGRFLGGHSIDLRGLSLIAPLAPAAAAARLDARWATLFARRGKTKAR